MISSYKRGVVERSVRNSLDRIDAFVQRQTFAPLLDKLNPNKLYREFFGIPPGEPKSPVSMNVLTTETFASLGLEHGLKLDMSKNGDFLLPVAPTVKLQITMLTNFFGVPGLTTSTNLWGARPTKSITLLATPGFPVPEPLVTRGVELLQSRLTEEEIDSVFRVVSLRENIECTRALDEYMGQCRSLGGLYKKLPVLNSIVPANSLGVTHVSMTRQTPDPPADLVTKLNLIATLLSARRSASGEQQ